MNSNLAFEIRARAFQLMTGKLAPGKDEPAAVNWEDRGDRLAAWMTWLEKYDPCIEAMLNAVDDITGDEEDPDPTPYIEP